MGRPPVVFFAANQAPGRKKWGSTSPADNWRWPHGGERCPSNQSIPWRDFFLLPAAGWRRRRQASGEGGCENVRPWGRHRKMFVFMLDKRLAGGSLCPPHRRRCYFFTVRRQTSMAEARDAARSRQNLRGSTRSRSCRPCAHPPLSPSLSNYSLNHPPSC